MKTNGTIYLLEKSVENFQMSKRKYFLCQHKYIKNNSANSERAFSNHLVTIIKKRTFRRVNKKLFISKHDTLNATYF